MKSMPPPVEPLEARIAPASVTVPFTDFDGDLVRVTASKAGPTAPPLNLGNFAFAGGGIGIVVDLTAAGFGGADITFAVTRHGGDGRVNLGKIDAAGIDLGKVTVNGDLATIDAGNTDTATAAIKLVDVRSMGRFGALTGAPNNLESDIHGALGALKVAGDAVNIYLQVDGGAVAANGRIDAITIGGSLLGGAAGFQGTMRVSGDIGPIKIGHDMIGVGGDSGQILSIGGKIGTVTIGGSLIGGAAGDSGVIGSSGAMGAVKIGHNLVGGEGTSSGQISAQGKLTSVSIGGSVTGGAGTASGAIFSHGEIGAVFIGHDLRGGAGDESGKIDSSGKIASVTIRGSVVGAAGKYNTITDANMVTHLGQIFAVGDLGAVNIGHDLRGGAGIESASILGHSHVGAVKIGGSLVGSAKDSGTVGSGLGIASVAVAHDVRGGAGFGSGIIGGSVDLPLVKIGGSLIGGDGDSSGGIFMLSGHLGTVKIGHDVVGGKGNAAGSIQTFGDTGTVKIGGSLIGGSGPNSGEIFTSLHLDSAQIGRDIIGALVVKAPFTNSGGISGGSIGSVTVGGSVVGAAGHVTGFILATGGDLGAVKIARDLRGGSITGAQLADESGYIEATGRIGSIGIGGSIIAGTDDSSDVLTKNASIRAGHDIGTIDVKGSVLGTVGSMGTTQAIISAGAQAAAPPPGTFASAIGKLTVGGSVVHASIFGDYSIALAPQGFGAQIGPVKVGRNWIASNLVAGVRNLGADDATGGTGANADNVNFGDAHDVLVGLGPISDAIVSVVIGGFVAGSATSGDHFGFCGVTVGSFKVGGFTATFAGNDMIQLSPATGDVTIHTF